MILEFNCPRYWNIDLDKLKADGKTIVIVDKGQIVGKIISMEERNNELYAKVELPKVNYNAYELGECHEHER